MFTKAALRAAQPGLRATSQVRTYKVAVLGAAGGIGQPLALLLKLNDKVTHLSLYDVAPVTPGVAAGQTSVSRGIAAPGMGHSLLQIRNVCSAGLAEAPFLFMFSLQVALSF